VESQLVQRLEGGIITGRGTNFILLF